MANHSALILKYLMDISFTKHKEQFYAIILKEYYKINLQLLKTTEFPDVFKNEFKIKYH